MVDRRKKENFSEARKASLQRFVEQYAGQGTSPKVSDKDLAKALIDRGGCINRTAKDLGYSTSWLGHRIKASPELSAVCTQARATMVHAVSEGLIDAALKVKDDPRYFQCAKLVLELFGAPHGINVPGSRSELCVTGTVTQKIDDAQVDAFKAALERAVRTQIGKIDDTGEVIDVTE